MQEAPIITKRLRKNFGKIRKIVDTPNLIGVQRDSYARFLQLKTAQDKRLDIGLQAVFKSVFPIKDFTGSASLEFVSYRFMEPKYSEKECNQRGMTYELPLRITVRLVVYDVDKETGDSNIRDIKEQESYFGTIPLMTARGTFVINGTERVVVSQLHRSSGVFFDHDKGTVHSSGKVIYTSRIIPVRGSWIDMEIDPKDIVYIRIDRRRKFPATLLFKAFGYSSEDIINYFYRLEKIVFKRGRYFKEFKDALHTLDSFKGKRAPCDIHDPETDEVILQKGKMFTRKALKKMRESSLEMIPIEKEDILDKFFPFGINHPETGESIVAGTEIVDEKALELLEEAGVTEFRLIHADSTSMSNSIVKTLILDKVENHEEALIEIFRRLRPGNPVTPEVARDFLDHMFFKSAYYDLSSVGRLKMNFRLGIKSASNLRILRREDIILAAKTLVDIRDTQGAVDDIDHLGNRRVRAVGELLENQYRIGLVRMERAIKERMSLQEVDALMPHDLLNPKPVSAVVKEFFGTSQLSQFMDQTNPLSETTHKRRLSALGPGGLTRERAGFEVRDVHPSHYGRICPIETPEGPNIGLIVSLSTYARVNDYGFIETPFSVVSDSSVTKDVKFLSAFEEKDHPIAQANAPLDKDGKYKNDLVTSRVEGELMIVKREDIEFMDISPNQLVSVSASLIPFLENDDANRALMGSNMQRQAVPLMVSNAPLVGTGMEGIVARDSGVTVVAGRDGTVISVDASRIVVAHEPNDDDEKENERLVTIYNLAKFMRSNQNTCVNQRPVVVEGQQIEAGEVIADGPATDRGELALGQNVNVAFMPWGGYNFEDSILVSERLVRDGIYTSGQIEEFELVARDTKLGREEITRDIPNVGDEALKDLDESGIIRIGATVKPTNILIGKITPKGETQLSPEEKLLRAIFGEKAGEVKDASLRVPPGVEGIVIDAKIFTRRGAEKDERTLEIEQDEIAAFEKDRDDELKVINEMAMGRLAGIMVGKTCASRFARRAKTLIEKGVQIDLEMIKDLPVSFFEDIELESEADSERVYDLVRLFQKHCDVCDGAFKKQVERFTKGDDLPPGVIKMVKVYVAMKRKLSVGDKMAGRHGNKGVVSRILPQEDMPYFENGEPVDVVLNPLGVPSRMNVGQILEVHLGRAAKILGEQLEILVNEKNFSDLRAKFKRIFFAENQIDEIDRLSDDQLVKISKDYKAGVFMATPVFDGAKEYEIKDLLEEAGIETTGQTRLYDGRTGEPFAEKITVGTMYILKLHHLVDDKIHARSIGPYSLVTQQPLGGKAQFGGQRLGEMEVWAMEGYGAAYALQEFLTVKSDDMAGRTRMYEKIVKGQNLLEPGLPESFKVLIKELQSLGLNITLMEKRNR